MDVDAPILCRPVLAALTPGARAGLAIEALTRLNATGGRRR